MSKLDRRFSVERRARAVTKYQREDLFPATGRMHPIARELISRTLHKLRDSFGPEFNVTLFLAEKTAPPLAVFAKPRPGRSTRFTFLSTSDRADIIAVITAFLEKYGVTTAGDATKMGPFTYRGHQVIVD